MDRNILDYIEWRGDLSFSQSGFNEADNLIFSLLAYFDFKGLIPAPGEGEISLQEAAKRVFENGTPTEEAGDVKRLLYAMANCRRYRKLRLSAAVDVLDRERATQFYAVCVHLNRNKAYLSFRGTDDDLAGWKEDFLLACMPEIPAQREALSYLERVAAL